MSSDTEIRRPGQPPRSFVDAQTIRPIPNVGETAPRPVHAPRGGPTAYAKPSREALNAIGRVTAGRYELTVSASRTARPAVQLRLDCQTFTKPIVFYATPGEVTELVALLEQACTELVGKGAK
jgi:hypothetical protein